MRPRRSRWQSCCTLLCMGATLSSLRTTRWPCGSGSLASACSPTRPSIICTKRRGRCGRRSRIRTASSCPRLVAPCPRPIPQPMRPAPATTPLKPAPSRRARASRTGGGRSRPRCWRACGRARSARPWAPTSRSLSSVQMASAHEFRSGAAPPWPSTRSTRRARRTTWISACCRRRARCQRARHCNHRCATSRVWRATGYTSAARSRPRRGPRPSRVPATA
mmetsp:Transcript_50491/g.130068  ORF Transcript_50491/g.130068 Transcript_50491/m.130068 type:complete len:221 (+) Transcript_50491:516-1178(+)